MVLAVVSTISFYGQSPAALTFKNDKFSRALTKSSLTLSNQSNNDLVILIVENKDLFAYLFNGDFSEKHYFQTNQIKKKYSTLLGYKVDGDVYHLLYSNTIKTKFAVFTVDFKSKKVNTKELEHKFYEDLYLETVTIKNIPYILSADEKNNLTISTLDSSLEIAPIKTFELGQDKNIKLLRNLLESSLFFRSYKGMDTMKSNIYKIDNRTPTPIEIASMPNKIYSINEKIYLTFEEVDSSTLVIEINLEKSSTNTFLIEYPKQESESFEKFNSFLTDTALFQIASSKEKMEVNVKDLQGNTLKNFKYSSIKEIEDKSSPYIISDPDLSLFHSQRELKDSEKFLKKVSYGNNAISCLTLDNIYHFTIGGSYRFKQANGGLAQTAFMGDYNEQAPIISFNPTTTSFYSYNNTVSTYFNLSLDKNFEPIRLTSESTIYENLLSHKKGIKYFTAENLFFHNNKLYYGKIDLKNREYSLNAL